MGKSPCTEGKMRQEKLEFLNSLQYSIRLREKSGKFCLTIPELALVATSDNLEEAYKDLCEQKSGVIARALDCDAEDEIALPRKIRTRREMYYELRLFACKVLILCLLGGLIFVMSSALLINKMANFSGGNVAKNLATNMIRGAETAIIHIPEEIKQERLKRIRRLVEALRPVAHEIEGLFRHPTEEERGANKGGLSGSEAK